MGEPLTGTGTYRRDQPHDRAGLGRVPDATEADIDKAVAPPARRSTRALAPHDAGGAGRVLTKVSAAIQADMQGIAELITMEMGSPVSWGHMAQVFAPPMILDYYAGSPRHLPVRRGPARAHG